MINYLLELSIIHTTMLLGYWFLLRQERQYTTMRFYLLGSTCLALILPLLHFPNISMTGQRSTDVVYLQAFDMNALQLNALELDVLSLASITDHSHLIFGGLLWIYVGISLILLFRFFRSLMYLVSLRRKSKCEQFEGHDIYIVRNFRGSFTFFNWIFVSEKIYNHHQNYSVMLKHEKAHVFMRHSYDLIYFELFKVFFWWLPTAWLIPVEIKKIHEFQADAFVLQSIDVDQYSSLLIRTALESNGLSLASSFRDGFIIKRLKAMKQETRNLRIWKLASLAGLGTLLIVILACGEEVDPEIGKIEQHGSYLTDDAGSEGQVFTIVEELPEFKGGMDAFYQYLRQEMRYPLEARKSGVEGRVDVQFVVEKNGTLSEVKAMQGIGSGCDREATRVVENSPLFNPGKQGGKPVRVRMLLPVVFKLDKARTNPDHSTQGIIIVEKAKIKKSLLKVDANYSNGAWTGRVYDDEGEALPGASVVTVGSTIGTVSDLKGTFKLRAPKASDLNISFVGYENVSIKAD